MASLTMTAAPATRPTPLVGFGSGDLEGEADVGPNATPRGHAAAGVPYERYETPPSASVPLAPLSLSARDLDLLSSSYSSPAESAPAAPDPPVASPTASTMGAADEAGIGIVGCGTVPNTVDTTVTTAASPPPAPLLSSPSAAILFGAALPNATDAVGGNGGIDRNDSSGSEDVEVRLAKTPPRGNANAHTNPLSRGLSSTAVLGGSVRSGRSQQQQQQMVHAIPKHSSTPAGVASVGMSEMARPGDSPHRVGASTAAATAESKPKKSFRKRLGLGGGIAGRRKGDEGSSGGRTSRLAAEALGGEDGGHRLSPPPPPPAHSMDPSPPEGSRASAVGSGVGSVASGVSTKSGRGRIKSPVPGLLRKRSTDTNDKLANAPIVERAQPPVQAQPKALSQSQQNHRASAGKPRPLHKRAVSSSGDSVTVGSLETIKASNVQRAASLAARRQRRTPAGVAAPPASALEKMEETAGGSALMGSAGKAASVNAADVDSGKGVHEKGGSQKPLKGLKRSIKKAFGLGRGVSSGSNSHDSHKNCKSTGKGDTISTGNSVAVVAGINAAKAANAAAAVGGAGRGGRGNMHRAASTREGLRPQKQHPQLGSSGEAVGNRRRLGSEPVVSTSGAASRPHSSDHARPTTTKPASESVRPKSSQSKQVQAQAQWGRQPTHDELMNDAAIRGRLDGLDSVSLGPAPASSLATTSPSSSSPVTAPPPMAIGSKYSSSARQSDGVSKDSSSATNSAKNGPPSPGGPSFFFQAESGVLYTPKDMVDDMLRRSGGKDPPEIVLEGYLPLGEDRWTVRIEKLPGDDKSEGGKDGKKKERAKRSSRGKKRPHRKKAARGRRTGPVDLDEEGPVDLDAEPAGPIDLDEVMDQDAAAEEEAASSSPLACGPLLALHSKGSSGSGSRPSSKPQPATETKAARAEEEGSGGDPNLKGSANSATSAPCDGETVSTSASTTELMSSASSDKSNQSSRSPSEKAKAAAASAVNLGEKMRDGGCCMFGSSAAIAAAAADSDSPAAPAAAPSSDQPAEKPDPPASSGGAGSGALAVYVSQRRVGDMHTASQATAEATAEAAAPAIHSAAGGTPTLAATTLEDSFLGQANSILTDTTNPPPLAPANSTGSATVSKTGEGGASAPVNANASGGGCGVPLRQLMTCMWGKENRPPPSHAHRAGASDSGTESDDNDSDSDSDDGTFDVLALAAASCPVDVDEDVFMIDTAEHLEAVHDIAASALRRGRFDRALAVFAKILESLLLRIEAGKGEGPCGGHRRLVGTTQHNMGIVHMWRGQYDLALKLLDDAVETRRECLQKDLKAHPAVAVSLAKKGLVLFALERHDEALLSLSEALEQRRRILSFDHLEMGKIHCAIGAVHYRRGDAISALKSFTSALEVQRLWLEGPVRREAIVFDASVTLANMGRIYVDRAECDMALYVYEEALLLQTTVFRKDHESVLTTLGNIAFAKARKGDHAKALQIYRGIYRSQVTKAGGPDSRRAAETMGLMAAMHLQLRHHGEAAVCLEALLDWQRRHVPGGDPALRNTETALKKLRRMLGEDEHELASTLSGSTADRSTF